jgi:hypothetical protein
MSSSIFANLLTNNYNNHTHTPRSSNSEDEDNDLSTLPFPQPLSRPTFSVIEEGKFGNATAAVVRLAKVFD